MKLLKKYLGGLLVALGLGSVFAVNRIWTQQAITNLPVSMPQTAFFSSGFKADVNGNPSSTGKYRSGTKLMEITTGGIITYVPLLSSGGSALTNWTTTGANIYNNNTGNVGIGTQSPATLFHVYGAAGGITLTRNTAGEPFILLQGGVSPKDLGQIRGDTASGGIKFTDGAGTTTYMKIASGGNVGIGVTNPINILHTFGSTAALFERSDSITNTYSNSFLAQHTSTGQMADGFETRITLINKDADAVQNVVGAIGSIRTTNDNSAALALYYGNTAGTLTEGLRINTTGNVGIGTTSPDVLLSLSAAAPAINLKVTGFTHSYGDTLYTHPNAAGTWTYRGGSAGGNTFVGIGKGANVPSIAFFGATDDTSPTGSPVMFVAGKRGTTSTVALASTEKAFSFFNATTAFSLGAELVTILGGGNVGIGTTSPAATLQVSGTTLFGNTLGSMSQTNGFTTRAGSGLARDDLNIVLLDTDSAAQKPALEVLNGSTIKGRCFDGGSQMQEMFGSVEIAHGVYLGTGAEFEIHAHWMGDTTSATTTGIWNIEYSKLSLGGIMGSSKIVSGAYYGITQRQYRLDDIAETNISLSGYNIGDTIVFRIYRDPTGADTYAGDMCLIQLGYHTRFDSLGSRTEYSK